MFREGTDREFDLTLSGRLYSPLGRRGLARTSTSELYLFEREVEGNGRFGYLLVRVGL